MMNINSEHKNIGVLISGGLDSTILYYILSKEKQMNQNIHLFSMLLSKPNMDVYKSRINNIIDYVSEKTTQPVNLTYFSKVILIRRAVETMLQSGMDVVYTGCNKVPDIEFSVKNIIPGDTPPFRGQPLNSQHLRPFIDLEKPEILKLYHNYQVNDLINLTHSCGISVVEECGVCFFCLEKKWGLESIINS